MNKPLVSILIPCFNRESILPATLESCLEQTYEDIEIILVDDGSTDQTFAVAQKYAAQRSNIKAFHTENKGQCAARNFGLSVAEGEYIKFLDSDDLLLPHAIECQVKALLHFNASLSMSCSKLFQSHELIEVREEILLKHSFSIQNGIRYESFFDLFGNHGSTFNEILVSKELVSSVGGFEPSLRAAEELNLILKIAIAHPRAKSMFQPETLLMKRLENDSLACKMRKQRDIPYLLLSLRNAAEFYLRNANVEQQDLKCYIFNRLYQTAIFAYRDGLKNYAINALRVWQSATLPFPPLNPWYHQLLHQIFGFELAELSLSVIRKIARISFKKQLVWLG